MGDTRSEAAAFRLQLFSRSDVFNIGLRSIVDAATKRLLSKFKGNKTRLDRFLQEVGLQLQPFNIEIPAWGEGILRMDAQEPQGAAHALVLAITSESEAFERFVQSHHGKDGSGQIKVYLAALALSKPGDNRGAIDLVQASISKIEHSKKSTSQTRIAKEGSRPKKCPLKAYLTEIIAKNPEATATELHDQACNQNYQFMFNDRMLSMTVAETTPLGIDWEALDSNNSKTFKKGKKTFKQFERLCSDIRHGR
ncbi:MAG: hypothetical protein FIB06_09495 [Betaproteobacteria bacterium]|nr:hypothetical protein [Betaproteobacteria bacterium]